MQYSLGNMLKGGGALNPDGLALDLAFALDRSFTTDPAAAGGALLTSRRGPAAKFSRGSGATQVNAAGLIEYAPENLMTRSEEFDHSGWIKLRSSVDDNATTDPAGTLNADKLIEDSSTGTHMTYRTAVLSSLVPHTFSVYAKADGRDFMYLQCGDGFPVNCHAYFDLSAGTKGTVGVNATANIEPAGNGWYRCSVTATPSSLTTNIFYIQPTAVNGSTSYAGDGASGIYLWGAQLERASTARTYYPTTTAAFHGPRFDHDPATGASKGLLIEEPRTNFATWSEKIDDASWTKTFCAADPEVAAAPNGLIVADKIVEDTTQNFHGIRKNATVATGTAFIASIYLKAGGRNFAVIYTTGPTGRGRFLSIPADGTGTVLGNVTATDAVVTLQYVGNGWYRATIEVNSGTGFGAPIEIYPAISGTNSNYLGDGVSGVFVWGAQIEAGAFPTSYIPTTSGTAARSADVCSITGADFSSFYNQSEGSMFADATPPTVSSINAVLYIGDGGTQFQSGIYKANSLLSAAGLRWGATTVSTGFVSQAAIATATDVATSRSKLAYGFKLDDFGFTYAGTLVGTDASGTLPATNPTQMGIGNRNGALQINGHIARIQYFRKRLSNAKLQTITAP